MSERTSQRIGQAARPQTVPTGLMQRKCACGTHTPGGGQCAACSRDSRGNAPAQTLRIGAANDRYEREADQIVEQVMRSPLPESGNADGRPQSRPPPQSGMQQSAVSMQLSLAALHFVSGGQPA